MLKVQQQANDEPPPPPPCSHPAGDLDFVTDTLGGFGVRRALTHTLMSRFLQVTRKISSFVHYQKLKKVFFFPSFFFHNTHLCWEVLQRQKAAEGGGAEINRPNRKASVCSV